jgi:integrase
MQKRKRDQDGIFERPDSPFWWASWTDRRGRTARRSTRIRKDEDPRQIEARRVRAGFIAEAEAEAPRPSPIRTFDELMEAYLDGPSTSKARRTQTRDIHSLKRLFPEFTGRELESITGADVRAYIALRQEHGAKPATINKELALMSAACNWAIKELEWSIPNPWQSRKLKEDHARTRFLTLEEADRLIDASEELARKDGRASHLPDFIRLAIYTGMRPMEVLGLEWRRVDLSLNLIYFDAMDQKNRKVGSVPINQAARVAILSRERNRRKDCPWLFANLDGSRIQSVKKSFATACKMAGFDDVHPHDLRRTFASWLVQLGAPIQQVSALLRHSGVEVTHRVYAHLAPETLAEASAMLNQTAKMRVVK